MLRNAAVYATIGVTNTEQAKKFYEDQLGLVPIQSDEENTGGTFYDCGNTKIFVYESKFGGTNQATSATWVVDDIHAEVEELKAKGVTFEHYDFPGVTYEGDIHVMGSMRAAWFKDPDGNILNISNS